MNLPANISWKRAVPIITGIIAATSYWLTADAGPSYWDCPEYLISALLLEVGHPPGNPGWMLTHRFVTSFFPDVTTQVAVVNLMSGLFSALAVMILCSISITVLRLVWEPHPNSKWRPFAIGISSAAAALCLAWSDSIWYSAVEAEVYAMSLFLSALTIWMALKWAISVSKAKRTRLLIAIFYLIGFSLGVHQLNLLALPAIAMIMASGCRHESHLTARRTAAFFAGCFAVAVILKGLMPGAMALAKAADIIAVNDFQLPFWSGALSIWILCIATTTLLALTLSRRWLNAGIVFWCLTAVLVGCSVYILIPLRAWSNPPVNEGDPSTASRFADYLDRRQYGSAPLFYGRTPQSKIMRLERISIGINGDTLRDYSWNAMKVVGKDMRRMIKGGHIPDRSRFLSDEDRALNKRLSMDSIPVGYAVAGFHTEPIYTPELNMIFPRIYASSPDDIRCYGDWTGMDSTNMVKVAVSEAIDSLGKPVPRRDSTGNETIRFGARPSYLQSLSFLTGYQIGYMYLRYLMWNFCGRQNDVPASGEIDHGNFITGIAPIDNFMLGDQSMLPEELGTDNDGHNVYWMIPFLLGLAGIIWLFVGSGQNLSMRPMRNAAWCSLVLFFMTGIAIAIYLNQTPGEPRERDYTFLGSYWTFAFWIASGMLLLLKSVSKKWLRAIVVAAICSLPAWMLAQNLRDHDRSNRSATLDYAENLLESLDKDAILFADGDNYIFPLWFAQEVMGIRRDVSVVCYSYLACDWYVPQLMTPRHGEEGIAMTASEGDVALGNFNLFRLPRAESDTSVAIDALRELYADSSPTPTLRHRWLRIGNDSHLTFDVLSIPGKSANSIAGLREIAVIDIIATNAASRYPRPVYWHQSLGRNKFTGFQPYTRQAMFARRLMPNAPDSLILTEESLNFLPKMKWGGLDRMHYPGPDVTSQAEIQRASLIRLAGSLAAANRHDLALHISRCALVRFPPDLIPFGIRAHSDSIYFEAPELARILKLSGEAEGDTAAIEDALAILKGDSLRREAYLRYRQAIPPSRRGAISPATNNRSVRKSL